MTRNPFDPLSIATKDAFQGKPSPSRVDVTFKNGEKITLDAGSDFRIWLKGRFIDLKLEDVKELRCFDEPLR